MKAIFNGALKVFFLFMICVEGHAADRVRLGYSSITANRLPLWLGQEARIFARHGINAELLLIPSGTTGVQALVAGEVQILSATGAPTKVQMVIMRPNMHEVVDVTRSMIDHDIDVLRLDTVKDHPELEITSYDDVGRLNDQLQEAIHLCTAHRISVEGTLLTEIEPMLAHAAAREGIARPKPATRVIPLVPDEASRHARRRHARLHRSLGELHARRQR